MRNIGIISAVFFICFVTMESHAQEKVLSLNDAIFLATRSHSAKAIAADSLKNELEDRIFKIGYLPHVSFSGSLPGLTNDITPITMPDCSEQFSHRFYMSSSASLSISQKIPFTGGMVSLSGGLSRLDNFLPERSSSYSMSLFSLSYSQSLSPYNPDRWDRKIHQKSQEINNVEQKQQIEHLKGEAAGLFFDLLSAQKRIDIHNTMLLRAKYLAERAEVLYAHGTILEIDMLDAKIDLSELERENTAEALSLAKRNLSVLLTDLGDNYRPQFDIGEIPDMPEHLNIETIVWRTLQYTKGLQRELAELQEGKRNQSAKAVLFPTISVSVSGGASSASQELRDIMTNPSRMSSAYVSISFPILNWGESRLKYNVAMAESEKTSIEYERQLKDFENTVRYEIANACLQRRLIETDGEIIEMLWKKLETLQNAFSAGKVDFGRIQETRRQILQAEINRISRIKGFYETVFRYRANALYDITSEMSL